MTCFILSPSDSLDQFVGQFWLARLVLLAHLFRSFRSPPDLFFSAVFLTIRLIFVLFFRHPNFSAWSGRRALTNKAVSVCPPHSFCSCPQYLPLSFISLIDECDPSGKPCPLQMCFLVCQGCPSYPSCSLSLEFLLMFNQRNLLFDMSFPSSLFCQLVLLPGL